MGWLHEEMCSLECPHPLTKKAELEFRLVAMGHNIRKIMRVVEAVRA